MRAKEKEKRNSISEIKSTKKRRKTPEKQYETKNCGTKEIDNLLNLMAENNTKTTSFKIFKYYQENNYNKIPYEKIISYLIQEYKTNPSNFLNGSDKPFNSVKKFLMSVKFALRNNAFKTIYNKNTKYLILNLPKTLEYLNNFKNKIPKNENNNETINNDNNGFLIDINKIKTNQFNNDNYIGKKRRRKKNETEIEGDNNKDNMDENNKSIIEFDKLNNRDDFKTKKQNKNVLKDNIGETEFNNSVTPSKKIYFEGTPMNMNLSSMTFCAGYSESIKMFSANTINNNSVSNHNIINTDIAKQQNEGKIEILYKSKDEEKIYNLLNEEIKPIWNRFNQLKILIENTQESILSISKILNTMDYIFNEYKNIKNKLIIDSDILSSCFKAIDNEIKVLNLCKNTDNIPFKDELFQKHHTYAKKILNLCKNIVDENCKKISKLNDYDFNFSFCKINIENKIKEITENKSELISVVNIECLINPKLLKYFKKINYESSNNESNNDVSIIYDNNYHLKNKYEEYVKKIELYTKNLIPVKMG